MAGMGDEIIGAPGSFSSWNIIDQMNFERDLHDAVREQYNTKMSEEAQILEDVELVSSWRHEDGRALTDEEIRSAVGDLIQLRTKLHEYEGEK